MASEDTTPVPLLLGGDACEGHNDWAWCLIGQRNPLSFDSQNWKEACPRPPSFVA